MLVIKKESAWRFLTSSSGGIGVEFVAAEGGSIYFQDPNGVTVTYRYGAAGAGVSAGLKLPKIGKLQFKGKSVGAAVAPAAFPNVGKLYILDSFPGDELSRSDITGVCMFAEVGGGVVVGGAGYAMLLGMSPLWLAAQASSAIMPPVMLYADYQMLQSATAVLFMAGLNAGLIAGIGAAVFVGGLF
jgi:hypothetical protein